MLPTTAIGTGRISKRYPHFEKRILANKAIVNSPIILVKRSVCLSVCQGFSLLLCIMSSTITHYFSSFKDKYIFLFNSFLEHPVRVD